MEKIEKKIVVYVYYNSLLKTVRSFTEFFKMFCETHAQSNCTSCLYEARPKCTHGTRIRECTNCWDVLSPTCKGHFIQGIFKCSQC